MIEPIELTESLEHSHSDYKLGPAILRHFISKPVVYRFDNAMLNWRMRRVPARQEDITSVTITDEALLEQVLKYEQDTVTAITPMLWQTEETGMVTGLHQIAA